MLSVIPLPLSFDFSLKVCDRIGHADFKVRVLFRRNDKYFLGKCYLAQGRKKVTPKVMHIFKIYLFMEFIEVPISLVFKLYKIYFHAWRCRSTPSI